MAASGPQKIPLGNWASRQLLLNKFFDLNTPSMRKGHHREKKQEKQKKRRKKRKRMMKIVATTSLPAVDCLNADRWNAASSCQC